ncbi:unnamed protein product [Clonostachys solani]|uniref:Uncharacterized protein n=1 Tax=Clonostachys solani TaxID=160281 RepID=A0A9N9ZC23_9HYPO|nr:unnamed protein product [Clonostachys solani]
MWRVDAGTRPTGKKKNKVERHDNAAHRGRGSWDGNRIGGRLLPICSHFTQPAIADIPAPPDIFVADW